MTGVQTCALPISRRLLSSAARSRDVGWPPRPPRNHSGLLRTNDDIWLLEHEAWGADRLAWEDEQENSQRETEDDQAPPEDPRY